MNKDGKGCGRSCGRWIVKIIIVLAVIAGAAYGIGTQLPAEHTATVTATYKATPDLLWETISSPEKIPEWNKEITKVESLPPQNGNPVWRYHGSMGPMDIEVTQSTFPRHVGKIVGPADLPFGGEWIFELEPAAGGGTVVKLTENGTMKNPFCRVIGKVMGYDWMLKKHLASMGTKFGETIEAK